MMFDANLFWSRVAPDTGGCRPFSSTFTNGYGCFAYKGRNWRAHRVAWILVYGYIPDGLCVLHRCDNPACCNTEHLFTGTQADNMRDKIAKGRGYFPGPRKPVRGDQHWTRLHPEWLARGDQNGARLHPERMKEAALARWVKRRLHKS